MGNVCFEKLLSSIIKGNILLVNECLPFILFLGSTLVRHTINAILGLRKMKDPTKPRRVLKSNHDLICQLISTAKGIILL